MKMLPWRVVVLLVCLAAIPSRGSAEEDVTVQQQQQQQQQQLNKIPETPVPSQNAKPPCEHAANSERNTQARAPEAASGLSTSTTGGERHPAKSSGRTIEQRTKFGGGKPSIQIVMPTAQPAINPYPSYPSYGYPPAYPSYPAYPPPPPQSPYPYPAHPPAQTNPPQTGSSTVIYTHPPYSSLYNPYNPYFAGGFGGGFPYGPGFGYGYGFRPGFGFFPPPPRPNNNDNNNVDNNNNNGGGRNFRGEFNDIPLAAAEYGFVDGPEEFFARSLGKQTEFPGGGARKTGTYVSAEGVGGPPAFGGGGGGGGSVKSSPFLSLFGVGSF